MIITGGFISHMIHAVKADPVNPIYPKHSFDVDIFTTRLDTFFHDKIKRDISWVHSDHGGYHQELSPTYHVYYNHRNILKNHGGALINLIITGENSPEDIVNKFDFEHCKPYWNSFDGKLYISEHQFDLILNERLETCEGKNPSQDRWDKYFSRGWSLTADKEDEKHYIT
jgi:hypothetical protein